MAYPGPSPWPERVTSKAVPRNARLVGVSPLFATNVRPVPIARALTRLRRTSLLVRFGLASGFLVLALGLVLASVLASTVQERALMQSERTAISVARLAVQPLLTRSDFESGAVGAARQGRLASALRTVTADSTVEEVRIFSRDGSLLFSDLDGPVEGASHTLPALESALDGEVTAIPRSDGLAEVYVPVQMTGADGEPEVLGAYQIYLPYGPVEAQVSDDVQRLVTWLVIGLAVLWLGLFQLMASASRRLREHARENERLAQHDALTGLPNRTLFVKRARDVVVGAERTGSAAAVLLADLDRFREVNDTLGHHIGDRLIAAVGSRLRDQLREMDTVARLGGDEFAVLLPRLSGADDALIVADRLISSLRSPFFVDGIVLEVDVSVGVALFPDHGRDVARLLQCADVAMYAAKSEHLGVAVYDADLDVNTPSRLALYGELRRAIEEDQLTLHYQPKVELVSGRVTGVEALVRWDHPERGLLQPDEFITVAEQTGLIRPMTMRLLATALRDCRKWRSAGQQLTVAVNLSVRSLLDDELTTEIAELLSSLRLPASALELEITETTAMVDPARAMLVLNQLRRLGVGLALDDYGTGHSSLAYLDELPVDTLKIDQSFVHAMDGSTHDTTIVRSTIDLARNLGLRVVAEGVDTEAALRQLAQLGCDAAQGFWLAGPVPAADVIEVVDRLGRRLEMDENGLLVQVEVEQSG